MVPQVRAALLLVAILALVGIGTTEAAISNDQLSQLPSRARPALSAGGAALTGIGLALSLAVYVILGALLARDRRPEATVLVTGMAVGAGAGLVGGAIRAYLVSGYLGDVLASYGLAGLLVVTLAVFVALSVAISVAAGGALTWVGYRVARRRPTPRPRS